MFLRAFIALLPLFLFTGQSYGQSSFHLDAKTTVDISHSLVECLYQYTNVVKEKLSNMEEKKSYNTILQVNNSVSKFWDYNSYKRDSIIYTSTLTVDSVKSLNHLYRSVKYLFIPVVLKNYPDGKITVTDEIVPFDYIYEEKQVEIGWTLGGDTLMVCGYLCYNAHASFGGREWTVWFAPEIAVSEGPWKLRGLPGLILKAEDDSGSHFFEAFCFRKASTPIYLNRNFSQIKIKKEKFLHDKFSFENDPLGALDSFPVDNITVLKNEGVLLINGKRMNADFNTIYSPLEIQ